MRWLQSAPMPTLTQSALTDYSSKSLSHAMNYDFVSCFALKYLSQIWVELGDVDPYSEGAAWEMKLYPMVLYEWYINISMDSSTSRNYDLPMFARHGRPRPKWWSNEVTLFIFSRQADPGDSVPARASNPFEDLVDYAATTGWIKECVGFNTNHALLSAISNFAFIWYRTNAKLTELGDGYELPSHSNPSHWSFHWLTHHRFFASSLHLYRRIMCDGTLHQYPEVNNLKDLVDVPVSPPCFIPVDLHGANSDSPHGATATVSSRDDPIENPEQQQHDDHNHANVDVTNDDSDLVVYVNPQPKLDPQPRTRKRGRIPWSAEEERTLEEGIATEGAGSYESIWINYFNSYDGGNDADGRTLSQVREKVRGFIKKLKKQKNRSRHVTLRRSSKYVSKQGEEA